MARRRRRASAKRGPGAPRRADAPHGAARGTATVPQPQAGKRRASREGRSRRPERVQRLRPQPAPAPVGAPAPPPVWPVHAAAAMLVFSAGVALLFALRELSYHTLLARDALLRGGAAVCAGVALGLWIPRQVIMRRLNRAAPLLAQPSRCDTPSDQSAPARTIANAAAPDRTLISALFVAAGGSLLLLGLFSTTMESLRSALAEHFMLAPWLMRAMLQAPAVLLLALAACLATIALAALHGLHRAAGAPRARIARLWVVIVVAAVASALAAAWTDDDFRRLILALLPVFAAGAVAALQQRRADGDRAVASSHTPASYVAFDLLLTVTVASAAAAYALVPCVVFFPSRPAWPEAPVLIAAAAALPGMLAGQSFGRRVRDLRPASTAALAVLGVAWAMPLHGTPLGPVVAPGIIVTVAVACIVLATRRISAACESAQYALSVVGACIAVGCGVVFISAPLWTDALPPGRVGALLSLGIMAVVGWLLMLDVRMPARVRRVGLVAVGLWLAAMPLAAGAAARPGGGAAETGALDAEKRLLMSCDLRSVVVRTPRDQAVNAEADSHDGWHADLSRDAHDLVIISRSQTHAGSGKTPPLDRRILMRCAAVVRRGGRVAIEDVDAHAARDAGALLAAAGRSDASAYLLRTAAVGSDHATLLIGRDVPAWINDARRRTDLSAELYHLENADALSVVLSSK